MRMFIMALMLTAFVGLAAAFSVKPDFIEVKDTGNENLPALDVGITIDCDSRDLIVQVESNETGEPVANANLYLFYTQYEYQLIASGSTGSDGEGTVNVIGNRDYLTRLFILRVENPAYQSREIEFMYTKCFEAPPSPPPSTPPTPPEPPANATNQTPNGNATPPAPPANVTPPSNATPPKPPAGNVTPPGRNGTEAPVAPPIQSPCPVTGLILISLVFLRARA